MIKLSTIISLFIILLLLQACSHKSTYSILEHERLTATTEGDFEIIEATKELAQVLGIPLYHDNKEFNKRKILDEVTLIKSQDSLRIILNGMIFQENSTVPIENSVHIIEEITKVIRKYPHLILQVTGHSDKNESSKNHQDLSDNRAISIAEILYKLDSKNETYAKGCADKKPLIKDLPRDEILTNARIEIYLYPNKANMVDQCR